MSETVFNPVGAKMLSYLRGEERRDISDVEKLRIHLLNLLNTYGSLSTAELREMCEDWGLKRTGRRIFDHLIYLQNQGLVVSRLTFRNGKRILWRLSA